MRAQQIAILDQLAKVKQAGVLNIGIPFLTLAELITAAETVLSQIGLPHQLSRATVQLWISAGLLAASQPRTSRNRLYSTADIMLLVLAAAGSRLGFSQGLCRGIVLAFRQLLSEDLKALGSLPGQTASVKHMILASPQSTDEGNGWELISGFDSKTNLANRIAIEPPSPFTVAIDPRLIFHLSSHAGANAFDAKAKLWANKVKAHMGNQKA